MPRKEGRKQASKARKEGKNGELKDGKRKKGKKEMKGGR